MDVDLKRWKEIWDNCPWSTAFSSLLWHAVCEEIEKVDATFDWEDIITPLKKIKLAKGLISGFESTVPGVPAGPISIERPDESKIGAYWKELEARTGGRFLIHLRPDSPFTRTDLKTVRLESHYLKIKERTERISAHHDRQLKKASKAGIKVKPARREEDFEVYCELYERSLERWNKKPARAYSRAFFEKVKDIILPAEKGMFYLAWQGNTPQAGALIMFGKTRAVYWHGVTTDRPVAGSGHMLHWKAMEMMEARGLGIYDFGPSPGLVGVQKFKQGFGVSTEEHITVVGPSSGFSAFYLKRANKKNKPND